ncbi:MAG: hypothetical protein PUC30_08280 [Lachnospiraceae bacterium]|nr:hypothetical protein [Lachnospiraceae bacterium]
MIYRKIRNICFILLFIGGILWIFITNSNAFIKLFNENYQYVTFDNFENINSSMDAKLQDALDNKVKRSMQDILGLTYKLLKVDVIGEFEYYYCDNRLFSLDKNMSNVPEYISELKELEKEVEVYGTKLIYVQVPDYCSEGLDYEMDEYVRQSIDTNAEIDQIIESLDDNLWNCFDMRDYISNENQDSITSDFRFRTDGHMTTETEWWLLSHIVDMLEIENKEKLDWNCYEIVTNDFLGNFGRSVGKYMLGLDKFVRLYPKYETNFCETNLSTGQRKIGTFEETVMNGYPKTGDAYTYWVTDYFSYGQAGITYDNLLNEEGLNILFICDSIGYRTASYLSLFVDSITILDPRFGGKTEMVWMPYYDYVIVMTQRGFWDCDFSRNLLVDADAKILDSYMEENQLCVKVKNTGNGIWNSRIGVGLSLWADGKDTGTRMYIENGIEIKPQEEYIFRLDISKLSFSAQITYDLQMLQEAYQYFGERKGINDIIFPRGIEEEIN